jgi:DNA helicase-2/ATP-dependent DNA helicase PcrA
VHDRFGYGTILRVEGAGEDAKLTVSFPGRGATRLLAKFAGLKPA